MIKSRSFIQSNTSNSSISSESLGMVFLSFLLTCLSGLTFRPICNETASGQSSITEKSVQNGIVTEVRLSPDSGRKSCALPLAKREVINEGLVSIDNGLVQVRSFG